MQIVLIALDIDQVGQINLLDPIRDLDIVNRIGFDGRDGFF